MVHPETRTTKNGRPQTPIAPKTHIMTETIQTHPFQEDTRMSFGEALVHLKEGDKVARKGWNGKNMFIFKTVGNTVPKDFIPKFASLPDSVKVFLLQKDQDVVFQDSITMYCADGTLQPGWLASQRDMLAFDWEVLP